MRPRRRSGAGSPKRGGREGAAGGFTLLETMVALLLFEVGLLAVAGMILLAQETLARALAVQRGTMEAAWVADSLRASGPLGEGASAFPGGVVEWRPDGEGEAALLVRSTLGGDTLGRFRVWIAPPGGGS